MGANEFLSDPGSIPPIHDALVSGIDVLGGHQSVPFTPYVRTVLPVDGFVFWLNAALLTPAQLAKAGLQSSSPVEVSVTSMHYSSHGSMDYDENIVIRRVDFTSEIEIDAFAEASNNVLFVGTWNTPWGSFRFSFSNRNSYYRQANISHYVGDAIFPAFEIQLIDSMASFDQRPVVSNSLPIWLALLTSVPFPSPITFNVPGFEFYPSFLVPDNLIPPYGVVDIGASATRALQAVPYRARDSSSYQLAADRVKLTFYGLRNDDIMDFRDYAYDYSQNTGIFGLMNDPVPRDEHRTQVELTALAQKKVMDIEVSYYQTRMRDLARQVIDKAVIGSFVPNNGPPFPIPPLPV